MVAIAILDDYQKVALKMAEEAGLDLVEIVPDQRPPICKIMDHGKFKYEQSKKEAKNKSAGKYAACRRLTGRHPSPDNWKSRPRARRNRANADVSKSSVSGRTRACPLRHTRYSLGVGSSGLGGLGTPGYDDQRSR